MGKITYQKSWGSGFKWVPGVNNNLSLAHCICCKTSFIMSASGISQLVNHNKGKKHVSKDSCKISNNQKQFNESVRLSNVGCSNVHWVNPYEIIQKKNIFNTLTSQNLFIFTSLAIHVKKITTAKILVKNTHGFQRYRQLK